MTIKENTVGTDKMPSNREAVILDILINGQRAGRDVRNEYESRTNTSLPLGSLYTTLARMERIGFVTSKPGDATAERRGHPRRFFSITGAGRSALTSYQEFILNAFGGAFENG
jgi:PadR family transcriptional regulator, regulatory protein PadR